MTGRTTKLAIALIAIVMAVGGSALAFGAAGPDRGAPAPAAAAGDAEGRDDDGRDEDDGREEDLHPAGWRRSSPARLRTRPR